MASSTVKFYLTTPLYYVNSKPHLGHAYTTMAADVLCRYKRMRGVDVCFVTGTDEHGEKNAEAARAAGKTPQEFVDLNAQSFADLWKALNIQYDYFVRTTQKEHEGVVQDVFRRILKKGDIYKGMYEGWYCVPDESFWTENQLVDGKCPMCGREVKWVQEENYFFRMSSYRDWLMDHLRTHPDFVQPESRRNELLARLSEDVRDLSISRISVPWGVPVPDDPAHTIYVWFEALLGYTTAVGNLWDETKFARYWPADLHLIGKEILWFHAAIWPAVLKAADLPLPKQVFAHGYWVMAGEKMSKSKGNVLDPNTLIPDIGVDGLRYWALREFPFGQDGSISYDAIYSRYNSDLANDFGNLAYRTISMVQRYCSGVIPAAATLTPAEEPLYELKGEVTEQTGALIERLQFKDALEQIWLLVDWGNKYIDTEKPWVLAKKDPARLAAVLHTLMDCLRALGTLVEPFMPATAESLWQQCGFDGRFQRQWEGIGAREDLSGVQVKPGKALFPRYEPEKPAGPEEAARLKPRPTEEKKGVTAAEPGLISIEEFKRIELRTAKIKSATRVEGADKLLQLEIDLGAETRQIVAGIALSYKPEDLVGKTIVVVANLQPATIRGLQSQGMLLAAGEGDRIAVLTPEKSDIPPGLRVK